MLEEVVTRGVHVLNEQEAALWGVIRQYVETRVPLQHREARLKAELLAIRGIPREISLVVRVTDPVEVWKLQTLVREYTSDPAAQHHSGMMVVLDGLAQKLFEWGHNEGHRLMQTGLANPPPEVTSA